jgi:hypothetical protein
MARLKLGMFFLTILILVGCSPGMPASGNLEDPAYSNRDRGGDGGGGGGSGM